MLGGGEDADAIADQPGPASPDAGDDMPLVVRFIGRRMMTNAPHGPRFPRSTELKGRSRWPTHPTDVLVAGYQDIDTATDDFERLVAQAAVEQVEIEGVILVAHAADGSVSVRQTGDHLGRKGARWGAGVGLAVGLFAPPMLAGTVATGAVAGGLVGKFVGHRVAERHARQDRREPAAGFGRGHRGVR